MTQAFHSGQPSHGGDRNTIDVMTLTLPSVTLGSVVSLLTVICYIEVSFKTALIVY